MWWKNLARYILLLAVSLLLLEIVLRCTLDPSNLYSGLQRLPELHARKMELKFFEKYNGRELSLDTFDPDLGWDFDIEADRIRGNKIYATRPDPGILRIISIGDSFTYGSEVAAEESFPQRLQDRLCHSEVLNMAVPGYGIDQAYWKYRKYGISYHADVLIFGIYTGDYARSGLRFGAYSKPYYAPLSAGGFRIRNHPVPGPAQELARIESDAVRSSYARTLFSNLVAQFGLLVSSGDGFFKRTDAVVHHILSMLKNDTQRHGTKLLIVQIPIAESFLRPVPPHDEAARRLVALYDDLRIPYIDVKSAFLETYPAGALVEALYIRRPDGSRGHLSPAGHRFLATRILEKLRNEGLIPASKKLASCAKDTFNKPATAAYTGLAHFDPE